MKKISYSAWGKYMSCPKMYDYHYNQRLRPDVRSSALKFGVAMDEALNHLLLTKEDPLPKFQEFFKFEDMEGLEWTAQDLDMDLFSDEQLAVVNEKSHEYKAWASMRIKGRLLLEAYQEYFYPLIKEVESVQKTIQERPGFLDAIIDLEGIGRVLIDHKTSARPYKFDAVANDAQLALYAHSEQIQKAGFVVLIKDIPKIKVCSNCDYNGTHARHRTCPQVKDGVRCHGTWTKTISKEGIIQVMVDDVPQINKDLITDSISQVEIAIREGIYPRNLKACGKYFGKPCPYINKCWRNQDYGLEYSKPTKEKK